MEFYPMPLFVKLSVSHMQRSLNWFKEVLNFESVYELPDDHSEKIMMAHIRGKKYQDIMLVVEYGDQEHNGKGIVINLAVDDVDAIALRAHKMSAEVVEGPIDRPWNARELVLKDPDGYLITLSTVLNKEESFDDVMEKVKRDNPSTK